MVIKNITYSLDDLDDVVEQFYQLLSQCKVFTFQGSLGAGKTTLVRALLRKCGVNEAITSPTFTYVNVYKNDQGARFYHFDLYRINSIQDFIQAGFDEYLFADNSWAFIEWPEVIMPLLKKDTCHVVLDYDENQDVRHAQLKII